MNQLLAMRTLVRVVDTGSFSRASDQLALPRSTVSKWSRTWKNTLASS
ncbi:LysR family transcriptional regulator [Pseudomonas kitaguniensis]